MTQRLGFKVENHTNNNSLSDVHYAFETYMLSYQKNFHRIGKNNVNVTSNTVYIKKEQLLYQTLLEIRKKLQMKNE